jgi:hypothetical protein
MVQRLLLISVLVFILVSCPRPGSEEGLSEANKPIYFDSLRCAQARAFCSDRNYNTEFALFSDMSVASGRKRFFLVDLSADTVVMSGLVAHGHCKKYGRRKPMFSNEVGSNCTSLGRYRVGGSYHGSFGKSYKLHGLDSSNSNAFDRFVVLHAHSCVSDYESSFGICRSEGCPTLSPNFLESLEPWLDNSEKSVLLWIYYGATQGE